MAYGPIGDLVAMQRTRISEDLPRRAAAEIEAAAKVKVTDRLRPYRPYARLLATQYYTQKSGEDGQDLEQIALIEAWKALDGWNPALSSEKSHVQARMRFAVLHAVRPESFTEAADMERLSYEAVLEGREL